MFFIKSITKWYRATKDKDGNIKYSFNHYEAGHADGDYPKPFDASYSNQVAWQKEEWKKVHSYSRVGVDHGTPYVRLL